MTDIKKLQAQGMKSVNDLVRELTVSRAKIAIKLQKLEGQTITKQTPFEVVGMSKKSLDHAKQRYLKGQDV